MSKTLSKAGHPVRMTEPFVRGSVSATPQQSEICVKFSVFYTVFGVKLMKFSESDTQTLENAACGKSHSNFTPNFHDTFGSETLRRQ